MLHQVVREHPQSYVSLLPLSNNQLIDVWCTAELSVALIVVSLPSLKALLRDRSLGALRSTSDGEMGSGSAILAKPRGGDTEMCIQTRNNWYKQV